MTKKTLKEKDLIFLSENILNKLYESGRNCVFLTGNLGAGKTTLVKNIARKLGIKKTVNSPTFVIMKEYFIKNENFPWEKLIHIDAYRLVAQSDIKVFNLEDLLQNKNYIVFIEWPDRFELKSDRCLEIKIESGADGERIFHF